MNGNMGKNFNVEFILFFSINIVLVTNVISCEEYFYECCQNCFCYENEEKSINDLIETIERCRLESIYPYIYEMFKIVFNKDILEKHYNLGNFFWKINKEIKEQEELGHFYFTVLHGLLVSFMNELKKLDGFFFNKKVGELLDLLLQKCKKMYVEKVSNANLEINIDYLDSLYKNIQSLQDLNGKINFFIFDENEMKDIYEYIEDILRLIYKGTSLFHINFDIKELITFIKDTNSLITNDNQKAESIDYFKEKQKKLINLSTNLDQNFFKDKKINNDSVLFVKENEKGRDVFYWEDLIEIQNTKYRQMIIPGDGNCLLYAILAYYDSLVCYEKNTGITASDESKVVAMELREALYYEVSKLINNVSTQLSKEENTSENDTIVAKKTLLENIREDLFTPLSFIDIGCLMIIAKYYDIDVCLYNKKQNYFLFFDKIGSGQVHITADDFNNKDGIKLIMVNDNHYELLKRQEN